MAGFIYIIRRSLHEYKNEPIYKVGKTENSNPFNYLKSRYDSGFGLHHIIQVPNASVIEAGLLKTLRSFPDRYQLYEGRETFKLSPGTDVYDIADVILDVIGEYIESCTVSNNVKRIEIDLNKLNLSDIPYEDLAENETSG